MINLTNVYRWNFDLSLAFISLELLQRGINHPVFPFYLAISRKNVFSSIDFHVHLVPILGKFFMTEEIFD